MIDVVINVPLSLCTFKSTIKDRSGVKRGCRSQDVKWVYKLNPPNPLGRHPFNILTEEIYND